MLPLSDCENFCNQDPNCRGYVEGFNPSRCQIATTSSCDQSGGISGGKYSAGNTGPLVGSCGTNYGGCYVKESSGMKLHFYKAFHKIKFYS